MSDAGVALAQAGFLYMVWMLSASKEVTMPYPRVCFQILPHKWWSMTFRAGHGGLLVPSMQFGVLNSWNMSAETFTTTTYPPFVRRRSFSSHIVNGEDGETSLCGVVSYLICSTAPFLLCDSIVDRHHVEVHNEVWWISKFTAYGFQYSQELTNKVRRIALDEQQQMIPSMVPGEPYNAQHLWNKLIVFINPAVAALPEHAHLFAEHGCYHNRTGDSIGHRECGTGGKAGLGESVLPASFYPIKLTDEMDTAWEDLVKKNIKQQ